MSSFQPQEFVPVAEDGDAVCELPERALPDASTSMPGSPDMESEPGRRRSFSSFFRPSLALGRESEGGLSRRSQGGGRSSLNLSRMSLGRISRPSSLMPNLGVAQASITRKWHSYETRRQEHKVRGMASAAIRFLRLLTTPKAMDVLNPHDWEDLGRLVKLRGRGRGGGAAAEEDAAAEAAAAGEGGGGEARDETNGDSLPPSPSRGGAELPSQASSSGEDSDSDEDEAPPALSPMPKSCVKHTQALMFVFESKAGMVASYSWGWGFLLNRLSSNADGSAVWSAPCFFRVHCASVGLTFGLSTRSTCYAFNSSESVRLNMYGRPVLGLDVNVVMDYLQSVYEGKVKYQRTGAPKVSFLDPEGGGALGGAGGQLVARYDAVDGSMIDMSVKMGVIWTSDDLHKRLYGRGGGAGVHPERILFDSGTRRPREFDRLYAWLAELAAESSI